MKVKIKSIEKKQWGDKTFWEITLDNDIVKNEKGENIEVKSRTCWNDSVQLWKAGQEVEADISEKDTDKGKKYYIKASAQGQKKGGGWQPRDKKEIAINCATAITCKMIEKSPTVETNDSLLALKFFYENIYGMIKD